MFDEIVLFRSSLHARLASGIATCRFGRNQTESLVVISQTQDKLIVLEISSIKPVDSIGGGDRSDQQDGEDQQSDLFESLGSLSNPSQQQLQLHYIAIKDVIHSVSAIATLLPQHDNASDYSTTTKDLLLIGCSRSVFVYDTLNQVNLHNVNVSSTISTIVHQEDDYTAVSPLINKQLNRLIVCGGPQKIHVLKIDSDSRQIIGNDNPIEITSERSIGDTISCLAQGNLSGLDLIISGSSENKLRIYILDSFDYNIQSCQLIINENSPIQCLCPIKTSEQTNNTRQHIDYDRHGGYKDNSMRSDGMLPLVDEMGDLASLATQSGDIMQPTQLEEMNYFAYGLASKFIGVNRLLVVPASKPQQSDYFDENEDEANNDYSTEEQENKSTKIVSERLWRQKTKQTPVSMQLFDLNGDGFDELLIGYQNGRLEARSPLTGQLLAVTRCFKRSSERLVGLVQVSAPSDETRRQQQSTETIDATNKQQSTATKALTVSRTLLACSASGTLVGFRSARADQRKPLRGFTGLSRPMQIDAEDWTTSLKASVGDGQATSGQYDAIGANKKQHNQDEQSADNNNGQQQLETKNEMLVEQQIESKGDDTLAIKSDSKQDGELLRRLSLLQNEQLDLEKRACQIYHATMHGLTSSVSSLNTMTLGNELLLRDAAQSSSVNIAYSWNFDSTKLKLRLTILIRTLLKRIELIELEDESKNCLPNGQLIINPIGTSSDKTGDRNVDVEYQLSQQQQDNKSGDKLPQTNQLVVVALLRTRRDEEAQIKLKVFCSSCEQQATSQLARLHYRLIDVPKFAMFALLAVPQSNRIDNKSLNRVSIDLGEDLNRLQVLDWLRENFLCFRFTSSSEMNRKNRGHQATLKSAEFDENPNSTTNSRLARNQEEISSLLRSSNPISQRQDDDRGGAGSANCYQFEFEFLDIRQTLRRPARQKHEQVDYDQEDEEDDRRRLMNSKTQRQQQQQQQQQRIRSNECKSVETIDFLAKISENSTGIPKTSAASTNLVKSAGDGEFSMLRLAATRMGKLELECENFELMVDVVRCLVVDRLNLKLSAKKFSSSSSSSLKSRSNNRKQIEAQIEPILGELERLNRTRELKESEIRIQSELYESADYTKNLMQQFEIAANQLNELNSMQSEKLTFSPLMPLAQSSISKELLNELSMMLSGAQNSAQAHYLNFKTRCQLEKQVEQLREKISFLTGCQSND